MTTNRQPLATRLAQIAAGVEAGMTPAQIARELGMKTHRVRRLASENGLDLGPQGRHFIAPRPGSSRMNHATVIERVAINLEALAASTRMVALDFAAITPDHARELCEIISPTMAILRSFHSSLKMRRDHEKAFTTAGGVNQVSTARIDGSMPRRATRTESRSRR